MRQGKKEYLQNLCIPLTNGFPSFEAVNCLGVILIILKNISSGVPRYKNSIFSRV